MLRLFSITALICNAALSLAGFAMLVDSPYTGVRMGACGAGTCVKSVDPGSPADGRIAPGDAVLGLDGAAIASLAFHEDPDYVRRLADLDRFWHAQDVLAGAISVGRPVSLRLERGGKPQSVSVTPAPFPAGAALARTFPIYLVGWTFLGIALLVLRRTQAEPARVFAWMAALVCIDWAAGAPFTVRDLSLAPWAFALLTRADLVASLLLVASFVHLALVFPRRLLAGRAHEAFVAALYTLALTGIGARALRLVDDTYLTSYAAFAAGLGAVVLLFVVQYARAASGVMRRQIKWVVAAVLASSLVYLLLSALPAAAGEGFVSVALTGLAFILIPLSFALAITRYRLLDVDSILDAAVVYGLTIAFLAGLEAALFAVLGPALAAARGRLTLYPVVAVLLLVTIYVPLRDTVRRGVERLFGRGRYDVENELRRFALCLGDGDAPISLFADTVERLLRPEGLAVLGGTPLAPVASRGSGADARLFALASSAAAGSGRGAQFGYELGASAGFDDALVFPLGQAHAAVLLARPGRSAYSRKDISLVESLGAALAGALESAALRADRDALEARFVAERDAVARELHDGLGNILTGIVVSSQAAGRVAATDPAAAGRMLRGIEDASIDAVDFMRAGLAVLDDPAADVGSAVRALTARLEPAFDAASIDLSVVCAPAAAALRPGPSVLLGITRIVQEALANVLKHAEARHVCVALEAEGGRLRVRVDDDGVGLPREGRTGGRGLAHIRDRAAALGGRVVITSTREAGTSIDLELLVHPKVEAPCG